MDKPETLPCHPYLWKMASRCNKVTGSCLRCQISPMSGGGTSPAFMSEAVAGQTGVRMRERCEAHDK